MPARAKATSPNASSTTRGIKADFGPGVGGAIRRDLHADCVLANPRSNEPVTARRGSALFRSEAKMQAVREAKGNFSGEDDVQTVDRRFCISGL